MAAVFNFSPNYLSQLFGKYGDSGFVEYITETRIAAAKEMLEQGDLKVYEIAEKLGYESAFYFSKVFKKVTGLSPAGISAKYLKSEAFMIQEQLAFLPEFLPDYRPFPLPKSAPHGWPYPRGKAALFESRRNRAANTPCAPAALPLAGFHPHRRVPHGRRLFFPPGAAVRTGMRRVRRAQRALSGCHCGYRMGALRGKRMALPAHNSYVRDTPAAAPAGHFAAYCRAFCRRDRGRCWR